MKKIFLAFFILFVYAGAAQQERSVLEGYLPAGETDGFSLSAQPEYYFGDELFSYINGGADIYLEYGIDGAVSAFYSNHEKQKIHLEIYLMQSAEAAYGICSVNGRASGKPFSKGCEGMLYESYLDLWKDRAFVRVSDMGGGNATALASAQKIAEKVCASIDGKTEKPLLITELEKAGVKSDNPKYFQGLVALNNVYSFGAGTIFGFDEGMAGQHHGKMFMIFRYKDEKTRYEWVQNAKGKIRSVRKFTDFQDRGEEGFSAVDKEGKAINFNEFGKYLMVLFDSGWEDSLSLSKVLEKTLK